MEKDIKGVELSGKVVIPPSKSDGQRAILCAGLSAGKSIIYNVGQSNDELAMIRNIQQFGAKVEIRENEIEVDGSINFPKNAEFNCGESGLGLRLMTSICAVFDGNHNHIRAWCFGHFADWPDQSARHAVGRLAGQSL